MAIHQEDYSQLQAHLQEVRFQLASLKSYGFEDEGSPTREELVAKLRILQWKIKHYAE